MALEDFGGKPSVTILENRTTGRKKTTSSAIIALIFFGSLVFLTLLSRKSCENALTPIPVRSPRGLSIAAVKFPRPLSYTWARVEICARQPDNQDTLIARKLPRAFGAANISETS